MADELSNVFEGRVLPRRKEGDVEVINLALYNPDGSPFELPVIPGPPPLDEWTELTDPQLGNGWLVLDGDNYPPRYRKRPEGMVEMQGMLNPGADAADIFTLPLEYRPTQKLYFLCPAHDSHYFVMTVGTDGKVQSAGAGPGISSPFADVVWVSLANISYSTE